MLEPVQQNLSCLIGADYYDTWTFWQDTAQTQAYDFTGWTQFTAVIGAIVLTEGNGLTVAHTQGKVFPVVARSVTLTMHYGTASHALSAIDANGKLGFLMDGIFTWEFSS